MRRGIVLVLLDSERGVEERMYPGEVSVSMLVSGFAVVLLPFRFRRVEGSLLKEV